MKKCQPCAQSKMSTICSFVHPEIPEGLGDQSREAVDCLGILACKFFNSGDHNENEILKSVAQPPSDVGFGY